MNPDTNAGATLITPRPLTTILSHNAPPLRVSDRLLDLATIPSNCEDETVRVGRRIDPYWADLWPTGARAAWMNTRNASAQVAAGMGRLPAYLTADAQKATLKVTDVSRLPAHLNVLAVLDTWRTATGEQIAAFTGQRNIASGKSKIMTDLFAADLVDVGIFSNVLYNTRNSSRGSLYRESGSRAFEKTVAPLLTYPEWVSTTCGIVNKSTGGQHDRHNVLTTEMALRIAELANNVGNVVGEKLSSADLLVNTGLGKPSGGYKYSRAADLTVIRSDGARIAVEITANAGTTLQGKMQHWADVIAENRMDDSGLAVLFILVDRQDGRINKANNIRNNVYRVLREVVRNTPGLSFDRVASRIGIADWREYFPAPGVVSPSFINLECDRPTGPAGEELWERAEFLSRRDLPFHPDGTWATDALDNMAMLRCTPHWLREGYTPPELWRVLLARARMKKIPVPALIRPAAVPAATPTRVFGEAFGFTAATKPPKRVRSER